MAGAPSLPGVYSFLDAGGEVLYIGKAVDIRSRLQGHLSNPGDARHRLLLQRAVTVEWTITKNEAEALVLESELIRLRKPPLNVMLRDSRRYPWIEVTTDERFPRLLITRQADVRERPRFGPYPDARNLRKLSDILLEMHPLRRCGGSSPPPADRPCLMGQLGRCPAPCVGGIDERGYAGRVKGIIDMLRGDWAGARKRIEKMMERAADDLDYEEAARLRDLLARLAGFGWPAPDGAGDRRSRDAAAVLDNWGVVMSIRDGRFTGVVRLPFEGSWRLAPEGERLAVLLRSYYSETQEIPSEVLTPEEPEGAGALSGWLSERRGGPVGIRVPRRGALRETVELARRDLRHFLARLEWKRPAGGRERTMAALEAVADVLDLPAPPGWMVCLDASTMQGSWAVAALVSFREGVPDKSGYRRFSMPAVLGRDDPAMIAEAVRRYGARLADEGERPDLFLVDGGVTQLRAAMGAAGDFPPGTRFAALAKREERLLDGRGEREVDLRPDSPPMVLLRSMRDEAHRFVISYHRSLRSRGELASVLDEVPGIGAATRTRLLSHFGSAARIAAASLEEIMEVPGVGRGRAMAVRRHLDRAAETEGRGDAQAETDG